MCPLLSNAISVPSGDHTGLEPEVEGRACNPDPSGWISHNAQQERVNTMPLFDQLGAESMTSPVVSWQRPVRSTFTNMRIERETGSLRLPPVVNIHNICLTF